MSTILQDASNAIVFWNNVRNNAPTIINYFDKGAYFSINRNDFASWRAKWDSLNKPANFKIHGYLGLRNYTGSTDFSLCLYCVDSHTDKKVVEGNENEYITHLKFSPYQRANLEQPFFNENMLSISQLDPLEALQRSTQWTLHKDTWLEQQSNMAQILVIPFKDLETLFSNPNIDSLICQPALTYDKGTDTFAMDLIIWGHSDTLGILAKYPQDLIQPIPPYSSVNPASSFQLLQHAI